MDNAQRKALEQEFDDKSAQLSVMMEHLEMMRPAFDRWTAAVRANAVMEAYEALRAENEEVERMQGHVSKATEEHKKALRSGEATLAAAAREGLSAQQTALDHALTLRQAAQNRYEETLRAQEFESESAFKAAYLAKPAFMNLDERFKPFSLDYMSLFARCKEIEALLSDEE